MITIEERAKELGKIIYDKFRSSTASIAIEKGYIRGAKEQRQIDIDRACKWELWDNNDNNNRSEICNSKSRR